MSALKTFILAMMVYPDVQKKAQASIDAYLQEERWPTFNDRAELPYIDALLKEVLRYARTDVVLCSYIC